jgi:hypothetical protein
VTDHALGIDVSTTKLALAWIATDDTISWHTHTISPSVDPSRRLVYWRSYLHSHAEAFLDDVVTVAVEIPWAVRPSFFLLGTAAVCVEALTACLRAPVLTLTAGEWKSRCGLSGAATKAQTACFAEGLGYGAGDGDVADALGIAYAGRLLWERSVAA